MSTAPAAVAAVAAPGVQTAQQFVAGIRERVAKIVVGQDIVVERVMIALLTGGHLLLQGLPGLAKTLLVNTIAKAINLEFKRVQFTVDMLPSDIIGSGNHRPKERRFPYPPRTDFHESAAGG